MLSRRPTCVLNSILVTQILLQAPAPALAGPTDDSTLMNARGQVAAPAAAVAAVGNDEFTGAATYTVPIEVAPGTGGMQPSLALVYSSQSRRDSWAGYGWDLRLPSISRSLKKGVPAYQNEDPNPDVFVLDGQELVADPSPVTPTCTDPAQPRWRYHTRIESFARIQRLCDESWTVQTKDGRKLRFGIDAGSRIERSSSGGIFEWLLATEEDLNGNAYRVSYASHGDAGMLYPIEIRYTLRRSGGSLVSIGGSSANDRVVSFTTEARPDAPLTYAAGFKRELQRRLWRVDVRASGTLIRRYQLAYAASPDSFRSLLQSVSQYGADADGTAPTAPLVTTFAYRSNVAEGKARWLSSPWTWATGSVGLSLMRADNRDHGVRLADIDGDGRPDLVKGLVEINASGPTLEAESGVYLNAGAGFSPTKSSSHAANWPVSEGIPFPLGFAQEVPDLGVAPQGNGAELVDLTGDGRADVIGNFALQSYDRHETPQYTEGWQLGYQAPWATSTGDSFQGLAVSEYFADPSSFTAIQQKTWTDPLDGHLLFHTGRLAFFGGNTRFGDLNGDGLLDLIVRGGENWSDLSELEPGDPYCLLRKNVSFVIYNKGGMTFETSTLQSGGRVEPTCVANQSVLSIDFQPCDLKVADAAAFSSCWKRTFFNVDEMLSSPIPANGWVVQAVPEYGNVVVDLNGDGLADSLAATTETDSTIHWAALNNGAKAYEEDTRWSLPTTTSQLNDLELMYDLFPAAPRLAVKTSKDLGVRLADVNGDGRVDVLQGVEGGAHATWLNDGDVNEASAPSPWVPTTQQWQLPSGVSFVAADGKDTGVRFVDLDGDGMVDIVDSQGGSNQVWLNDGEIPDLLVSVVNPLGGTTTVGYGVSTQYDNTGGDGIPDLPHAMPVVTSITQAPNVSGASGPAVATTFSYTGGSFDAADREFRGFREVRTTRSDLLRRTRYHQDAARAGFVESDRLSDLAGSACYLDTQITYTSATGDAPFRSLPKYVYRSEYEGRPCSDASLARRTQTTYVYGAGDADPYGNLTEIREWGEVAGTTDVVPSDTRRVVYEYAAPNDALYLAGLVCRQSLYDNASALLGQTRTFYGGGALCAAASTPNPSRVQEMKTASTVGPVIDFGYDAYGNLTSFTDPRGFTSSIEYDDTYEAFPTQMDTPPVAGAPDGLRTVLGYSPAASCPSGSFTSPPGAGLAYRVVDANAKTTARCFDAHGRLLRETAPEASAETTLAYLTAPTRVQRTDSIDAGSTRTTTTWLDGLGRPYQSEVQGPNTIGGAARTIRTVAVYDGKGRMQSQSDPFFTSDSPRTTTFGYDPLDRVTSVLLPSAGLAGSGRLTTTSYDVAAGEAGGLYAAAKVTRITETDGSGHARRGELDPFGSVVAVREIGSGAVTHYRYRVTGSLDRVTDAQGNLTTIAYADLLERDRTLIDSDTGTTVFAHDASGNLTSRTDAAGVVTTWSYDAIGRPLVRTVGGGFDAAWSYDTAGNGKGLLATRTDGSGQYRVDAYDPVGRPLEEQRTIDGRTHRFQNGWDRIGQLRSRTYPTNRELTWIHDSRGYLSSIRDVTDSKNYATALDWDAQLRLSSWTAGNGFKRTQAFDAIAPATGRLRELEIRNATAAEQRWQYGYQHDDAITSITDALTPSRNRSFGYDALDRLTSATVTEGALRTFDYDALGNATCIEKNGASCATPAATLVYPTPAQPGPRHAPRTVNGVLAAYTPTGNLSYWEPAGAARRTFGYDAHGRLTSVVRNGATWASFRYNADGLRITTERLVGARTTRSHIVAEDFEWDETRGLARVHVMQGGAAIATVTSSWSGPTQAIVPPLAPRGASWTLPDSLPAPAPLAALAALLLALAQLESLRRRGIPLARPALASLTLAAFVATTLVPAAAWSAPTDGDYNDDDRLDGRDVLHAMRIARGEIAASAADEDRLDVAPLGAAPQSPSTVDAGDVVLLLRGATGADVDGDGLGTDEELALGASPFKVDSDSDGLSDGFEVAAGTDPTDRDSNDNGLPDWLEDADGDDLINSNEEAAGTDPVFADTDGDGLTDSLDPDPRASVLYLFRDHQGSVVLVVREDGSVARRSLWSAFGKTDWYAASNPPPGNSPGYVGTFGYTGQRYEPAVDLYDYDARWYEPKLARFLQPDPVVPEPFRPQSLNRYSYVLNDPVNRIDPSGYTSTCSLESPGSCPGGTIGSGYDSGDYRGDDFDYGSADAGRGPGSLLRYYRRRNQGDASDGGRPQRPEHIWLTDFLGLPERLPARFFEPPSADLGPGQGLIPSAFNCGGTFCGQSPSSAPYVALPLLAPQAAARLAVAGGEVALTALGQSPRIKAALDSAGIFRPGFTSVGKLLPKSWQSGRFLPANAWASGYTAQFSAGFAAAQSDPGQAAWDTGTRSFRAGYVAGTIYSWWPQ